MQIERIWNAAANCVAMLATSTASAPTSVVLCNVQQLNVHAISVIWSAEFTINEGTRCHGLVIQNTMDASGWRRRRRRRNLALTARRPMLALTTLLSLFYPMSSMCRLLIQLVLLPHTSSFYFDLSSPSHWLYLPLRPFTPVLPFVLLVIQDFAVA